MRMHIKERSLCICDLSFQSFHWTDMLWGSVLKRQSVPFSALFKFEIMHILVISHTSVIMSSLPLVAPISGIFMAKPKSDSTQVMFGLTSIFLLLISRWTKHGLPSLLSEKKNSENIMINMLGYCKKGLKEMTSHMVLRKGRNKPGKQKDSKLDLPQMKPET